MKRRRGKGWEGWERRHGRHRRHRREQRVEVEPPAREHHLGSILIGWSWAKLTKAWRTICKDAVKVKCRQATWEGERYDGMCNRDMRVICVVNLNIGGWLGKSRGSARGGPSTPLRWRR